jgi:mono/diheme cytochrome c family protein
MNRGWKWAAAGLAGVAVIALCGLAYIYIASEQIIARSYPLLPSHIHASRDRSAIARGHHFVLAYGCANCHRENLQGAFIPDLAVTSRNLTRLAKTYSDADFDHAIRHGLRPDGTSVAQEMPADAFQFVSDADLSDIISYIRSLPPAGDDIPPPSYDLEARYKLLFGGGKLDVMWFADQTPALDVGPKYARGRQLAMAACGECHTTSLRGQPGAEPDLQIVASYDRADFFHFMRTGKAAGNRELPLMSDMARQRFSHFDDVELGEIYDYLAARGQKLTASPQ